MTRDFWINLPVKDVVRSTTFFRALGFSFIEERTNDRMGSMSVGRSGVVVVLFPDAVFSGFASAPVADAGAGAEVLFSIDAESPADVDGVIEKVRVAGGTVFSEPAEAQGWMYGAGFADLDGHRWSVIHMDWSRAP